MTDPLLLLRLLLLIGVANGMPILATRVFKDWLAAPVDGGLQFFDGRPLFGSSKTIRGVVASMAVTPIIGLLLDFDFSLAASLAGLSMLADLGSSFVKRRLGLDVHARAFGLDQVPEALLPLLLFRSNLGLNWSDIVVVVLAFVLFEMVLSRVLYKIGIRAQPY